MHGDYTPLTSKRTTAFADGWTDGNVQEGWEAAWIPLDPYRGQLFICKPLICCLFNVTINISNHLVTVYNGSEEYISE
jgi:hypothetical protein